MTRIWFDVRAAADGTSADINIFDFIGDWIDDLWGWGGNGVTTAKSFTDALAALPESVKTIRVHINSPGGDVFGGITIANALRAQQANGRTVETIVEGLAASAASIVAMGGGKVVMADNALMMVHAPWSIAIGNAIDMRRTADDLDTILDALVKTYQWHSPLSTDEILALVDGVDHQGSWLDADAAIANGFATDKVEGLKAAASLDPRAVAKLTVPDKYRARVDALLATPAPPPAAASAADVLRLCREGDCLDLAEGLVAAGATLDVVRDQVAMARTARAAAAARVSEITALCAAAQQPDLAAGYISGGMSTAAVRAHLTLITAKLDAIEIDGTLDPTQGSRRTPRIDPSAIYAARNALTTTN